MKHNFNNVGEINDYSLGYSSALRYVEEDQENNVLKDKDFYMSLANTCEYSDDAYNSGWRDGVDELLP